MDTRIALGVNPLVIPDQSASLQKALTLNALMGQSDLQSLNLQEGQRTLKRNQSLDALAANSSTDEDYMAGLRKIDPAAAFKLQQQRLEGQKTQGEVDKSNRENDAAIANAIINASPQDRPAVYAQLRQQEIAKGNKNAAASPPEWNEAILPHIIAQQQKGLATKDALERQDEDRARRPSPTVAALSAEPQFNATPAAPVTQEWGSAPATPPIQSGAGTALGGGSGVVGGGAGYGATGSQAPGSAQVIPPVNAPAPSAFAPAEPAVSATKKVVATPSDESVMPQMDVNARGANPKIAEYRAEADRQMSQVGGKVGRENAKYFAEEADRLERADIAARDKYGQAPDAPGIVYNKATGEYSMDGKPISAADIQKVALSYADAKGTKLTVENYPNPTTVTDPKTGEQKSVQFGKNGSYREVPYKPPSNDSERLAAGYYDRMGAAEKIISTIGAAGEPTVGQAVGESLGSVPGRVASSPQQQQYRQAQSDWVRAKLRKESGAVIGPKEMQDEIDTYFPRLGDGPEVIKQKAEARAIAQDAMLKNAGPAATDNPKRRASDKTKTIRFEDLP